MTVADPLDLIIIGGGLGGVISLHYARQAGLKALLLEKQPVVGGLWAQLPAWQDIQINTCDWTLGDLPISNEYQSGIVANIRAWVDKFKLAPDMQLNTPVTRAAETASGWQVDTPTGSYHSRYLVCATGGHNRPVIPPTLREQATVRELHSSALQDPAELAGRDVLVVGGGASAFDLLDMCFEQGARRAVWLHRSIKWMVPTRKPKNVAGDVRWLGKQQMEGMTLERINAGVNQDLRQRYQKLGLLEIMPEGSFDFGQHQLIPGRSRMIENFARIERHRGEIASIRGGTVQLASGVQLRPDLLLWCTGYALDMGYFASPAISGITSVSALAQRCGSLFKSLDAKNLFFLAVGLEGTGSAPWAYSLGCKSIAAHIAGKAHFGDEPIARKINHYELLEFLAARDPHNYPDRSWVQQYTELALHHPEGVPLPIP